MTKKRTLTPGEKKLWQAVTQHDKKLHKHLEEEGLLEEAIEEKPAKHQRLPTVKIKPRTPELPQDYKHSAPKLGHYANIDRNTAEKLKRGDWDIDGTLDLHGYTRDKAQVALKRFIASHYQRGSRALLVVTGRGIKPSPGEEPRGILREMLPTWLADEEYSATVLAFDVAKPKHGGPGAFYVLLRRKR